MDKPEVLEVSIGESGEWVIAVDHYSPSGVASYTIEIKPVDSIGARSIQSPRNSLDKNTYLSNADSDLDGIPNSIENSIPILFDPNNPLIPAIYPPLTLIIAIAIIHLKRKKKR